MACGNNHVTRDYLTSQPTTAASQSQRLFNSTRRARDQIMLVDGKGQHRLVEERYSNVRRNGTIEYFLDENRNKTLDSKLHVHVIHKPDGDVNMHITDRRGGDRAVHSHGTALRQPDGNAVNRAEQALAAILGNMKSADQGPSA